jgi:hypothetical protein
MNKKIEFEEIVDSLEPIDCIDQLIRHLELIKHDIQDPNYDYDAMIASISIRYNGVKSLYGLLTKYLKQHNIK